jgi:tetratricopeptide (TPR) repeat protein
MPAAHPSAGNSAVAVDLFNEFGAAPQEAPLPPDPLFDGLVAPAPAPAPAPARRSSPGMRPQPAGGGDPLLDFLGPPPQAPPPPVQQPPRRTSGAVAALSGVPPQAAMPQAPAPMPRAPVQAPVGCRECNKPLTDPFDQAIGTCEDCRNKLQAGPASAAAAATAAASPAPSSSFELPPLESIDVSGVSSQAPALTLEPRSGSRSNPPRPSSFVSGAQQAAQPLQMRSSGSGMGGVIKGLLVVLLLLGAGGGGAYYFLVVKPQSELPELPVPPTGPAPLPAAIQAVLPRWELKYLDLNGSSMERLEQGAKHLAKDQRSAYVEAEEYFQQALLLDPKSDAAIAGYVQAVAFGRGTSVDKATFDEALSLIEAAEERAGRTALMLLAHANLLLCRPNNPELVEQAKQLAQEALNTGTDMEKAEAHLVLGRTYLRTSMGLANQHFDEALRLSPTLKRVQYHRALANESAGSYSLALAALKGRLEKDPEHWDSLVTMARIYLEVGELEEARKLYEARAKAQPNDVRVLLALAVMRYQVDGNAAAAVRDLRALVKNRQRYPEREIAEVLVHLAAAERMAGNVDAGVKAAEEAVGLVKDLPGAHLQLFLAALGRGDAAKATQYLPGFQGKIEDVALEKVLEGRLRLAEKNPTKALELFYEAVKLDSRRHDALLLAGIAAAQGGRRDDAFRIFFQALQSDPIRLNPRPVTTLYFLRPGETLTGMAGSVLVLQASREDVSAPLYEGLLLFHLGERAGAERQFKAVLDLDPNNAAASSYMALLALQRGDGAKARTFGARAVASGRQMPIAHLANGLALAAEGKQVEPAKRSLRDALTLAPATLSAEVKLAELELTSNPESARGRLVKAAGLDPSYLIAKRLLFITDQRG